MLCFFVYNKLIHFRLQPFGNSISAIEDTAVRNEEAKNYHLAIVRQCVSIQNTTPRH